MAAWLSNLITEHVAQVQDLIWWQTLSGMRSVFHLPLKVVYGVDAHISVM